VPTTLKAMSDTVVTNDAVLHGEYRLFGIIFPLLLYSYLSSMLKIKDIIYV